MATLTYVQASVAAGADPGFTAAAGGGDKVAPNDHGMVIVNNGGGSPINVTVAVPGNTRYGIANPDPVTAVPAGAFRVFGPFPSDLADPTDGLVHLAYSAVTSVTVGAVIC